MEIARFPRCTAAAAPGAIQTDESSRTVAENQFSGETSLAGSEINRY